MGPLDKLYSHLDYTPVERAFLQEDPETGFMTDISYSVDGEIESHLIYVHRPSQCADHHCAIHGTASIHPLSMEPLLWDPEYQTLQRLCVHGVVHPDKDNVDYFVKNGGYPYTHDEDCDGCCRADGYKGIH